MSGIEITLLVIIVIVFLFSLVGIGNRSVEIEAVRSVFKTEIKNEENRANHRIQSVRADCDIQINKIQKKVELFILKDNPIKIGSYVSVEFIPRSPHVMQVHTEAIKTKGFVTHIRLCDNLAPIYLVSAPEGQAEIYSENKIKLLKCKKDK